MSDTKLPPFSFSVPDRDTGELREIRFDFSSLTNEKAFVWERQAYYARTVLNQWLALLKQVTEKDAESMAYQVRLRQRRDESPAAK